MQLNMNYKTIRKFIQVNWSKVNFFTKKVNIAVM